MLTGERPVDNRPRDAIPPHMPWRVVTLRLLPLTLDLAARSHTGARVAAIRPTRSGARCTATKKSHRRFRRPSVRARPAPAGLTGGPRCADPPGFTAQIPIT